jgi:hypothetical protein
MIQTYSLILIFEAWHKTLPKRLPSLVDQSAVPAKFSRGFITIDF